MLMAARPYSGAFTLMVSTGASVSGPQMGCDALLVPLMTSLPLAESTV